MRTLSTITAIIAVALAAAGPALADVTVKSPDGRIAAVISADADGRLTYRISMAGEAVIEPSSLGVIVDGKDVGKSVTLGRVKRSRKEETYPWLGGHSTAVNQYRGAAIAVKSAAADLTYTLEVRAFDSGVGVRYRIPGGGSRTVTGEATVFTVPAQTDVWFQTNTGSYEKPYKKYSLGDIPENTYMGPPMVAVLPDGIGYAAVSEAALFDYSGMTLKARGQGSPVFEAAFQDDKSWTISGTIVTPWRVVMIGADLNAMVNSDIIWNLCPPPSKKLADADWIRPGRALWHWWSGKIGNWDSVAFDLQKGWVDAAAEFGFEYYLVDAGWEHTWTAPGKDKWAHVKQLCDYAKDKGVGIIVWKRWKTGKTEGIIMNGLDSDEMRRDFFKHCHDAGVVAIKIDYMDSESKERVGFYEDVLSDAVDAKLMVNFHGANKPTGEPRTWPNEITREGVQGLEYNKWSNLAPEHYASLPFTRYLVGNGDFTPGTFNVGMLKGTTFSLQLASAVCFTSPIMHWADKPENYRNSGALDVIKEIPSVWDETVVLAGSQIGEFAALARRSGDKWFIGIINGSSVVSRGYTLELDFLGKGSYDARLLADIPGMPEGFDRSERKVTGADTVTVKTNPGGGFVAVLTPQR